MRFIQAAGIATHYALEGVEDAPVILFANSLGTDFRIWDAVADGLRADYRLLRYDMRGHGLTDVTPGPYGIGQLAADAVALLDALDIAKAHICGLSIGGMVAQELAAAYPERVRRAIFCDTAMRIGNSQDWIQRAETVRRDGIAAIADGVVQRWFTPDFSARDRAGYRNMLCRSSAEGYAACCEAIGDSDLRAQAASVRAPALVVVGEQDPSTPPEAAARLAEALPKGRLRVLPGASHIACVEQPRALADAIRSFLREEPA